MASSLSIYGLYFDEEKDRYLIAKLANDTTMDTETRIVAIMTAIHFKAISFSKAESLLEEIGVVKDTHEAFGRYCKRLKEITEKEKTRNTPQNRIKEENN